LSDLAESVSRRERENRSGIVARVRLLETARMEAVPPRGKGTVEIARVRLGILPEQDVYPTFWDDGISFQGPVSIHITNLESVAALSQYPIGQQFVLRLEPIESQE